MSATAVIIRVVLVLFGVAGLGNVHAQSLGGPLLSEPITTGGASSALDFERLEDVSQPGFSPTMPMRLVDPDSVRRTVETLAIQPAPLAPAQGLYVDAESSPAQLLTGLAEDDVWLGEQVLLETADASRTSGPGLSDVLRGLVNLNLDDTSPASMAPAPEAAPAGGTGLGLGATLGDMMREMLVEAVDPYRRADGRVGFSVFGIGEFIAEVDGSLRNFRLFEEKTGLSVDFSRPAAGMQEPSADERKVEPLLEPPTISGLAITPVQPSDLRLGERLGNAWKWLTESIMVRVLLAAWLLAIAVRGLVGLDATMREHRRRSQRLAGTGPHPVITEAQKREAAMEPAGASQSGRIASRRRRSRRARTSPRIDQLLRAFGVR